MAWSRKGPSPQMKEGRVSSVTESKRAWDKTPSSDESIKENNSKGHWVFSPSADFYVPVFSLFAQGGPTHPAKACRLGLLFLWSDYGQACEEI